MTNNQEIVILTNESEVISKLLKTLSIFDEEEEIPKPKIIGKPRSTVIKRMVRRLQNSGGILYEEEINRLLRATNNRQYQDEFVYHEKENISKVLVKALETSGRSLEIIVHVAEQILKVKPNFYVKYAIDYAIEGESLQILRKCMCTPVGDLEDNPSKPKLTIRR